MAVDGHLAGRLRLCGPVIFPLKSDVAVLQAQDALIGDGDAVGVAANVLQHLNRAAEGWLGIDDPRGAAQRHEEAPESLPVMEGGQCPVELELTGGASLFQRGEEASAKLATEHADRDQKTRMAAGNPAQVIGR